MRERRMDPAQYAEFIRKCREAAVKENLERHLDEKDFAEKVRQKSNGVWEYAGGFTSTDGHFKARCPKCGAEKDFACSTIRTETFSRTSCANCRRIARETAAKLRKAQLEVEKNQVTGEQLGFEICKQCGALFVPEGSRKKFCSAECGLKYHNSRREHHAIRQKRKTEQTVDKDITLEKLFERDGGKCYLCGHICDWDDCKIIDGVFIAGGKYPSVEHIVPLSKGGEHSWNNVKLACRRCNSVKRDQSPFKK